MEKLPKDMEGEGLTVIANELHSQTKQIFDKIVETDWRLTQHNFLVNAGGSTAVLAYLGTSASSKFAVWPLIFFLVGVMASGVEMRALLAFYKGLHDDALSRLSGFMKNELSVEKVVPPTDVATFPSRVNHWSGWVAQISFVLGVVVGMILFLCCTP